MIANAKTSGLPAVIAKAGIGRARRQIAGDGKNILSAIIGKAGYQNSAVGLYRDGLAIIVARAKSLG